MDGPTYQSPNEVGSILAWRDVDDAGSCSPAGKISAAVVAALLVVVVAFAGASARGGGGAVAGRRKARFDALGCHYLTCVRSDNESGGGTFTCFWEGDGKVLVKATADGNKAYIGDAPDLNDYLGLKPDDFYDVACYQYGIFMDNVFCETGTGQFDLRCTKGELALDCRICNY